MSQFKDDTIHPYLIENPDMESMAVVSSYIETKLEEAEVGIRQSSKISIAVDELYSNIVRYSGAANAEITCLITEENITIVFRDNGIPYNPLLVKEPDTTLNAEDRKIGGLGIFMTRKLMNDVSYINENGWNVVTIRLDR